MANEFKHKTVGSELSQTEYESTGGHVLDSQARGDIIYASSTTQLSRLAVGGAGAVLTSDGTDPAWDTTWSPTGHLIPASDDSYDLGSASAAWQDLFLEGDITLTDAGTLATSAGALTITSAAAATWSTSAGALTLNGTGGVALQEGGSPIISISDARAITTANTASIALDATGVIELNSSGGALSIGNDNVDQTINIATAGTRTLNIGIGDGTDVTTTLVKGTLSVGVDDAGYDVIFYGDAASANMTWDASVDDLILNGAARIVVPEGQLVLGSTAVGSTAAELNVLDGVTAGTVAASKGVVVDANKDIGSFRNLTATGELDAATLDLSSSADIAGDLVLSGGADGALQFTNAGENSIKIPDNQASALIIEEADNAYITFVTTDSSEAITVAKATSFSSNVTVTGNLTVNGTTTTVDTTNTTIKDSLIELNNGVASGSNSNDSGLLIERGSTGNNAIFMWDESATGFTVGTTTSTAASTGNLANFTAAPFTAAAITGTTGVFTTSIDVSGSTGIILENDETITNSTNGEVAINGTVVVGTGGAAGTLKSSGNYDLTLATGNSTTGTITITDGSNGDIAIAPNGTGAVTVADDLKLTSDSAVLAFGADGDATLTHTDDVGITLNSTNKLMFNDASQFIQGTSATVLSIGATDEIDLTATAVDLNGTLNVSGVLTTGSTIELGHATATTLSGSSGELSVEGSVVKKVGTEDMWIPAAAMAPTATAGCADIQSVETTAGRPDMRVLDFDASTQEYAQFSVAMPKSWNESTVTAEFYWTTTATDTDACIWAIQAVTVSNDETIDQVFGAAQTVTDNVISGAEEILISPTTSAVAMNSGGAPAAGDLAFFQVYRDADDGSDTMAEDARLIGVKLHYTTDASTDA
jgi:hypothetical protein